MAILRRLKESRTIQKDFYVFDTETRGKKARPESFIFGVVYGWNFQKIIYSVEEFKKEFQDKRYKKKKVFCHNAEYDLNVIYGNIYELDNEAIYNGKFICASNGNCMFADSTNIYKTSVRKLGALLGMDKIETDEGYEEYYKVKSKADISKKMIDNCIRDCEIVYESLLRAFEFSGSIKITQAGLSMNYYRRFHMPFDIHSNNHVNHFYKSYYGGRVEAFKLGNVFANVLDVNSMYPYIMKTSTFPNPKFIKHTNRTKGIRIDNILNKFEGMIYADVIHKDSDIGLLPVKSNGKLIFPVGKFSGYWNFPEIRFALGKGILQIKKIHEITYSIPMESPFISFVDYLYNKRFEINDKFEILRIKIFMNSLYGKFGQNIEESTVYIEDIYNSPFLDEYREKNKNVQLALFNNERTDAFLIVKNNIHKPAYCIPSFASYITSNSRIMLADKILKYGKSCVYCDTDSIFIETEPREKTALNDNNIPILGAWKKENKIVTKINGLKNYEFEVNGLKKLRIKGIPIYNSSGKQNAIQDNNGIWHYESMIKTREGLRRNLDAGIFVQRSKKLSGKYDKRIVLNNETKPIKL